MKTIAKITVMVACIGFMTSCGGKKKEDTTAKTDSTTQIQAKTVKVMPITIQEVSIEEVYPATIQAWQEAHVGPAAPGQIHKIYVNVGDKVSKGTLLAQMDPTQYNQVRIQYQDAKRDLQRMDSLIKYGNISQQTYDKIKLQNEVLQTNLQTLGDNVFLKAPFPGVITGKYFNERENYSGMAAAVGVGAIFTIMQVNELKVIVSVSERFFPIVKKGMKTKLLTDIYPDKKFEGVIETVYPTIDAATKTFKIEIKVPNPQELLRPGMYARVAFDFGKAKAMVVPANAVLKQEGTNERYVFIFDNGKAIRIPVELGTRFNEQIEIRSEKITPGMQLIYTGHTGLINEQAVEIK